MEGISRLLEKYKIYYKKNDIAYYSVLERLLYQYAVNRDMEKTKKLVKEISNIKGIPKTLVMKLKIRVVKWLIFGGRVI